MPPVRQSTIDLTVIVTAHGEGRLLRPTLRSVTAAIEALDGRSVELLIVRDSVDAATRRETDRWVEIGAATHSMRTLDVRLGESGASRNAGAEAARGEFVAFVDGDDLVSADYLVGALEVLGRAATPLIVHPHLVVSFGARTLLWRTESTREHDICYRDLIRHNLWPSSAVTRRTVFLAHPYRSLPPEAGYGPEDWIWNIDTSAAGVAHDFVPDSVFFYRVREHGGVNNRHAVSILPEFDIEGLRRHLPPVDRPTALPARLPRSLRGALVRTYHLGRPLARRATSWLSPDVRRFLYQSARWTARTATGRGRDQPVAAVGVAAHVTRSLIAAAELDPAISWAAYRFDELPEWHARDDGYAEVLEAALDGLAAERGGAIVAVPWVGIGGADLVSLNYARALAEAPRFAGRVTMLGTFLEERTRHDLLPEGIRYVHLHPRWLDLAPHIRRRLVAQLIVLARPELVVSVNCFHFTESLQSHSAQMVDGTRTFATLFAFDRIGAGFPVNPITDDSHRGHLDAIDGLITDNTTTAQLIEDIVALPSDKVLVHRQPADALRRLGVRWSASEDDSFDAEHPFRLIWPHRIDEEKCPEALLGIAGELRRRGVPAVIEIRGQRVLTADGSSLLEDLGRAGVLYRGPYSGGLAGIEPERYHALLLTSKSEGLPLVLVQALHLGLPVIATRVGGVPDIIHEGATGLLVDGPADADGFVTAIQRLMTDRELRRRLIDGGVAFAAERHSWASFGRQVTESLVEHRETPAAVRDIGAPAV